MKNTIENPTKCICRIVRTKGNINLRIISYIGTIETPVGEIDLYVLKKEWNSYIKYADNKKISTGIGTVIQYKNKFYYLNISAITLVDNRIMLTKEKIETLIKS